MGGIGVELVPEAGGAVAEAEEVVVAAGKNRTAPRAAAPAVMDLAELPLPLVLELALLLVVLMAPWSPLALALAAQSGLVVGAWPCCWLRDTDRRSPLARRSTLRSGSVPV